MQGQHAGPPRRRHPVLIGLGLAVAGILFLVLVIVIVSTAIGGHSVTKTGGTPPAAASSSESAQSAPSDSSAGTVGTSFTVTSTDDNGNPVTYKVALTKFDMHAQLAPFNTLSNPADHMVAARFTITGVKGQSSDDVLSNATAITSATDTIDTSLNDVTDGSAFNSGAWQVGPGQTVSGWAAFEVGPNVKVAQVRWTPTAGMSDSSATWNV